MRGSDLMGDELRAMRGWATGRVNSGIGRGWWGSAWVWLNLVRAGVARDEVRTRRAIGRRLRQSAAPDRWIGAIVGGGAGPVVAALLTHIDPGARPVLDAQLAVWEGSCRGLHPPDLLYGSAGALLAAAEIDALCPGAVPRALAAAQGREVTAALERLLGPESAAEEVFLGLAHGIAGLLLALEAGRVAFALPFARDLRVRAIDFLLEARLRGPGNIAGWPLTPVDRIVPNAWCNGTAGVALAAVAGQRLSGDAAYAPLVDCALPSTFVLRGGRSVYCCGAIGQAQILLEGHHLLGDGCWLRRARRRAAQCDLPRGGNRTFNQGSLGARYLELRLAHPGRLPLPGLGPLSA